MTYTVAQIGYMGEPHTLKLPHITEQGLANGLTANGCHVDGHNEGTLEDWHTLIRNLPRYDFIIWTHNAGLEAVQRVPIDIKHELVDRANARNIPIVGYHPDAFWGVLREPNLKMFSFQATDIFCTPDGGNQDRFAEIGLNHHWFPSGVDRSECTLGRKIDGVPPLAFVGGRKNYHPAWPHRKLLVRHLIRIGCQLYPQEGQPKVAGKHLDNLYASAEVVIGDSANPTGNGYTWSNRIPKTLGRGGVLVHPYVAGLDLHYEIGHEIECYEPYNWDQLDKLIAELRADPARRARQSEAGRKRVLADHTYDSRMRTLIELLRTERLIK